jgi:hypothetical protein
MRRMEEGGRESVWSCVDRDKETGEAPQRGEGKGKGGISLGRKRTSR